MVSDETPEAVPLIDEALLELAQEESSVPQSLRTRSLPSTDINDNSRDEEQAGEESDAPAILKACRHCGSLSRLEEALADIGLYVCRTCCNKNRETHNYRRISQGVAFAQYGLSAKDLEEYEKGGLPYSKRRDGTPACDNGESERTYDLPLERRIVFTQRPNPRGFGNQMKLFYLFQIIDVCLAKYGSLEEIDRVVEKRQQDRFARALEADSEKRAVKSRKRRTASISEAEVGKADLDKSKRGRGKRRLPEHPGQRPASPVHCDHVFDETAIEAGSGRHTRECKRCHFREQWEEL